MKKGGIIMLKKLLSKVLALTVVSSTLTAMSSHALAFYVENDSEIYTNTVNHYNERYQSYPELLDAINADLVGDGNTDGYYSNVWRLDNGENENYFEGYFEYTHYDSLNLKIVDTTADDLNSLLAEMGIDEETARAYVPYDTSAYSIPMIFFFGGGDNVKLADDITKAAREKYGSRVISATGSFNVIQFLQTSYHFKMWTTYNKSGHYLDRKSVPLDEVNAALKENGFVPYFDTEKRSIIYPEGCSVEDKIRFRTFVYENFDICIDVYTLCEANESGNRVDFLADGVKGDANLDGKATVADSVAILQHIANRDKYGLKQQGLINADVDGEAGVTANDARVLQEWDANK